MKKGKAKWAIYVAMAILLTICPSMAKAQGQAKQDQPLCFNSDGQFTIMQIADVQEYGKVNRDALRVIGAALDQVKPDLVVFTGDQVEGYASYFKYGNREQKVMQTIDNILAPLDERGVSFAVVFGNHDQEAGMAKEAQMGMYQAHPGCRAIDEGAFISGCGTYNLPILSSDGSRTAFNLYLVDSNSMAAGGGYDVVHPDQIAYCKAISDELTAENDGTPVPSLLFQHIPVQELYQVLKEVPEGTDGAQKWYRDLHPGLFMIDEENVVGSNTDQFSYREPIASSDENSGQFGSWLEQGDIIGAYFGHDHINNFVGNYQGIDLGYGLGTSYNAYGAGKEGGVRVFQLDEANPAAYSTYTLQYQELCGEKMLDPVASFFSAKLSFPATEAAFYASAVLAGAAVIGVAFVLIVKKTKKAKSTVKKEKSTVTK